MMTAMKMTMQPMPSTKDMLSPASSTPEEDGEHGFQTHDQSSHSRFRVLLSDHLQSEGYAGREYAAVHDRQPAVDDVGKHRILKEEHEHDADDAHREKLDAGQLDTVAFRRKVVDDHDVAGKRYSAEQHEEIAGLQVEALAFARHGQQVEAYRAQGNAEPDDRPDLLLQQAQDRHDDDVQRRDESGFSRVSLKVKAELLQVGGDAQHQAAAEAAFDQNLFSASLSSAVFAAAASFCPAFETRR